MTMFWDSPSSNHYAVYRGKDETHPVAEMKVKTTYKKGFGKSYDILSQSGSEIHTKDWLEPPAGQ